MLDHHGPIRALQFGLVFVAAGLVLLSQPVGLIGLFGALLVGLGLAPNTPAGSQVLMRTAPARHRTLVFSIKQAGVPLGGAIAGLVIAPLVLGFGFTGAIWALVAVILLSALLVQPFQRELDAEKGPQNRAWARLFLSPSSLARSARVLSAHPSLPMLTAMGVAFSISQASITAFTATYMVTQHGQTLAQAGHYIAVLLAASTIARIFFGWLADRMGGRAPAAFAAGAWSRDRNRPARQLHEREPLAGLWLHGAGRRHLDGVERGTHGRACPGIAACADRRRDVRRQPVRLRRLDLRASGLRHYRQPDREFRVAVRAGRRPAGRVRPVRALAPVPNARRLRPDRGRSALSAGGEARRALPPAAIGFGRGLRLRPVS
jgi:hypothetical protein